MPNKVQQRLGTSLREISETQVYVDANLEPSGLSDYGRILTDARCQDTFIRAQYLLVIEDARYDHSPVWHTQLQFA
jgi:hypothetical protein